MECLTIRELYKETERYVDSRVTVGGWIRTNRDSKSFGFLVLHDGTFFETLQIVYSADKLDNFAEIAALGAVEYEEKSMTVFPRLDDGTPFVWDYQWKGYFKDCCGMLRRADGTLSKKLKAYKKEIDGLIFVKPRMIPITLNGKVGICERPLRASTPQGERVALASSEEIPAGSTITFKVLALRAGLLPAVREWLDYGLFRGLRQWRNSGKGRFVWEELDANDNVIGGTYDMKDFWTEDV